jgi:hypothetical protein
LTYIVYWKDNSETDHPGRKLGEFEDMEAAIAACQRFVDRSLDECGSGSAGDLFSQYCSFGEDAWIISDDPACKFSAWDYAKQRCQEIAAAKRAVRGTG